VGNWNPVVQTHYSTGSYSALNTHAVSKWNTKIE